MHTRATILLLFLLCPLGVSGEGLQLRDSHRIYSANEALFRLQGGNSPLAEVLNSLEDFDRWESVAHERYFGNLEQGSWFMVPFVSTGINVEFFFQLDYYSIDYLDFYLVHEGRVLRQASSGIYQFNEILPFNYIGHTLPLGFLDSGEYQLVFRVETDEAYLPLRFLSAVELLNESNRHLLFYGLVYGVLITFLLVNIYFIIFNRENSRSTLYFMLFLLFELLYQASRDGFLNIFFWPDNPFLIKRFFLVSLTVANLWGFLPLSEFLRIKAVSRRLHFVVMLHIIPSISFFILFLAVPKAMIPGVMAVGRYFQMYLILFEMLVTMGRIRKGTLPDRVFSIGWILGMVFFLLATLKAKGILPYQHFQLFVLAGVVWVTVCQLIASGLRARENSLHKARVEAKLKQAGYQIMQNRGRPHFLMNTFSLLKKRLLEDPFKAQELLSLLIQDFTFYTRKALKPLIPLGEEIQFLENYRKIIETRFEDIHFIDSSPELANCLVLVPPISLQPLVENAVKYAAYTDGRRDIEIACKTCHGRVFWMIENATDLQEPVVWGETHRNIFSRLSYYHPEVKMELSIVNGKYRVEVEIPIK